MEKIILNCKCGNRYTFYHDDPVEFVAENNPSYAEYAGKFWIIDGVCPSCQKKEGE